MQIIHINFLRNNTNNAVFALQLGSASVYFVTWFHANKLPKQTNNLVNCVQIKSVIKTNFTIQSSYKWQILLAACPTSSDSCILSHINFTSCSHISWKNHITAEKWSLVNICNINRSHCCCSTYNRWQLYAKTGLKEIRNSTINVQYLKTWNLHRCGILVSIVGMRDVYGIWQRQQIREVMWQTKNNCLVKYHCNLSVVPSVLWRCWLGDRKGIRPVKNWVVRCWRGYLSGTRCRLAYGPADATATHCLLLQ